MRFSWLLLSYKRKPPEEYIRWGKAKVDFCPFGRIPPNSGGWHRDVLSRSVAEALNPPTLDTGNSLRHQL